MRHKTDVLFPLILFCVFAVMALGLVVTGAGVYSRTVSSMEEGYSSRTALAYVAEKLRQNDRAGAVSVSDNVLSLYDSDENGAYVLYIYSYEGYLTELSTREDLDFSPEAGQKLLKLSDFSVSETAEGMIRVSVRAEGGDEASMLLCPRASR